MLKQEIYTFTTKEVREMMRIYEENSPKEALDRWAYEKGYYSGDYNVDIKDNEIIITDIP